MEPEVVCRALDHEEVGEVGSAVARPKARLLLEHAAAGEEVVAVGVEWQVDFQIWNLTWFLKRCLSCEGVVEGVSMVHHSLTDVNYHKRQTGTWNGVGELWQIHCCYQRSCSGPAP